LNTSITKRVVLIGASTGGPRQIEKILSELKVLDETSIVIAQHMAYGFVDSFAKSLQDKSKNRVSIIHNNTLFESCTVYLCTGMTEVLSKHGSMKFFTKDSTTHNFNPDINMIFNSFIPFTQNVKILSVILTGIGDDGVNATKELSIRGVRCITENASSAIVDGMPSRARLLVPNIEVLSLDEIIDEINRFCK